MSIFAKAKKARENKKGFTLVELIVVLVILAILAAMMVPALLGWIDEARNKQYVLEARSVYMAAQAVADEAYGFGTTKDLKAILNDAANTGRICTLADLPAGSLGTGWVANVNNGITGLEGKDKYKIQTIKFTFKSANGNTITAELPKNGNWAVEVSTPST